MKSATKDRYDVMCGLQCVAFQTLLSSLPLLGFLVYFLYETSQRASKPIYNLPYGSNADTVEAAVEKTGDIIALTSMLNTFMIVAAFATCFAVYMSFFVPWHRELVEEFLNRGSRIIGDIHYNSRVVCPRFQKQGCALYPHPEYNTYPLQIRKHLMVHERFTREKVTILLLPEQPFSGQCKSDLQIELTRIQRNAPRTRFHQAYGWIWVLFTVTAPIYILFVIDDLVKDGEYYINDYTEDTALAWSIYAGCLVSIPVLAGLLTWMLWKHHHYQLVRGDAKFLAEGDSKTGSWYAMGSDDEDMSGYGSGYEPPLTPEGSVSSMNRKQSIFLT